MFELNEYQCAIDTINNLKKISGKDPIDSLTSEEQADWHNALAIINAYKNSRNSEDTDNNNNNSNTKNIADRRTNAGLGRIARGYSRQGR